MARKPRIHYDGAIYHVIARGNNRQVIFSTPGDKMKYLELLVKYRQRYSCDILAYTLMDNHLHLLIRINLTPLSKVMQAIQQCYTQYFNRKYNHVGHVFQQRYKAFLCQNDRHLAALVVYIHENPVRAGLFGGIDYQWSSHKEYVAGSSQMTNVNFILEMLHSDRGLAIAQYLEMIGLNQMPPLLSKVSLPDESSVGGGNGDVNCGVLNRLTLDEIVEKIVSDYGVEKEKLLGPCRERKIVSARNRLIYEAIIHGILKRSELAKRLQIDPARVTRSFRQVEELMRNKSISQA